MFALDKPLGLTSLQALDALRASDASLRDERLGHAGRLDPMAEGLLTVLVGDETRLAPTLRDQDKTYELDALFGVATDSFDSLGLLTAIAPVVVDAALLAAACASWVGAVEQRYPPFSQARVAGRSLLAWGSAGVTMERPTAARRIDALTVIALDALDGDAVVREAVRRTGLVEGAFRQREIAAAWEAQRDVLRGFPIARASLRVTCSAGTYMRSLAYDLGAAMGAPALAWRIRRTRAGSLTLDGARRLP